MTAFIDAALSSLPYRRRAIVSTPDLRPVRKLALIGTWNDVGKEVDHVRHTVAAAGGWASWWSFSVDPDYRDKLTIPFFLYLNEGGDRISYRMRIEEMAYTTNREGMESPWREMTWDAHRDKRRIAEGKSQVFKTWFRVGAIEQVTPPLRRIDFTPARGSLNGLLSQSSFGYAYPPDSEPEAGSASDEYAAPRATGASVVTETAYTDRAARNIILFGPPGTGKTHRLRQLFQEYTSPADSVDESEWLQQAVSSYSWRAVIAATLHALGDSGFVRQIRDHAWMVAKARERGRGGNMDQSIWSTLQAHTAESVVAVRSQARRPPFIFSRTEADAEWSLLPSWEEMDEDAAALYRTLEAGLTSQSRAAITRYQVVTFHPSYSYEDFIQGIRPVFDEESGSTSFRPVDGVFKRICREASANPSHRYALFIDEINRANIAKVFGELITLLEIDKRVRYGLDGQIEAGMVVHLPGVASEEEEPLFGVPFNLDIYGTMNTADRSIALLDIALRRRFEFHEIPPNYDVLSPVGGVDTSALLRRINDRLEFLLDRDHRIGHAYLMEAASLADLRRTFEMQVIPLLQEYFFDNLSKVAAILDGDGSAPAFVVAERVVRRDLFPSKRVKEGPEDRWRHRVTDAATWTEATFRAIYAAPPEGNDDAPPDDEDDGDEQ